MDNLIETTMQSDDRRKYMIGLGVKFNDLTNEEKEILYTQYLRDYNETLKKHNNLVDEYNNLVEKLLNKKGIITRKYIKKLLKGDIK